MCAYPASLQDAMVGRAMDCMDAVEQAMQDGAITQAEYADIIENHRQLIALAEQQELTTKWAIHAIRTGNIESVWHKRQQREMAQNAVTLRAK